MATHGCSPRRMGLSENILTLHSIVLILSCSPFSLVNPNFAIQNCHFWMGIPILRQTHTANTSLWIKRNGNMGLRQSSSPVVFGVFQGSCLEEIVVCECCCSRCWVHVKSRPAIFNAEKCGYANNLWICICWKQKVWVSKIEYEPTRTNCEESPNRYS